MSVVKRTGVGAQSGARINLDFCPGRSSIMISLGLDPHGKREQEFRHMLLFAHGLHADQAGRIGICRDKPARLRQGSLTRRASSVRVGTSRYGT
jgi:hypothetical protein